MTNLARLSSLAIFALLFPISAGCQPSIGNAEDGSEEGSSDSQSSTPTGSADEGGEFMPCTASNPCPDGQFCFNGLCAIGCQSNADCAADQYCDTEFDMLCHNKTVSTCPDVACPEGQECVNGFCSAGPTDEVCMQMPNGEDGCAKNELCYAESDDPESAKCYAFPACAADDTCPKGTTGAVCNTGLIPSKGHICLIGACTDAAEHCPDGDKCVKFTGGEIGSCSSGAFGDLCNVGADCASNMCNMPFPGEPGFCM